MMGDSDGVVRESVSIETGSEERGPAYIKGLRWGSIHGACCTKAVEERMRLGRQGL